VTSGLVVLQETQLPAVEGRHSTEARVQEAAIGAVLATDIAILVKVEVVAGLVGGAATDVHSNPARIAGLEPCTSQHHQCTVTS